MEFDRNVENLASSTNNFDEQKRELSQMHLANKKLKADLYSNIAQNKEHLHKAQEENLELEKQLDSV